MTTEKKLYILLILFLIVIVGVAVIKTAKPPTANETVISGPILGSDKAAIKIIDNFDFACAHCQAASPILLEIYEKYPKDVSIEFRPLPSSPGGQLAARGLLCATDDQQLLALYNYAMLQQGNVKVDDLQAIVVSLDGNQEKFTTCLDDQTTRQKLTKLLVMATKEGVTSVPVMTVNGLVTNWQNITAQVDSLLANLQ